MTETVFILGGLEFTYNDDETDVWEYEIVNPKGRIPIGRGSAFKLSEPDK